MNQSEQILLADLKESFPDFKCVMNDLRNPTEDFVTNFYSRWLAEFEVDIGNIGQIQFNQGSVVGSYQDAFSSIIPKANLLKCIRAFEIVPDFGMLDIIKPTPRRTQHNLRAFIDFFKWADQRVANIFEKKQGVQDRKAALLKLLKEREDTRGNLNSITKDIAAIQDEKAQIEEDLLKLQQKTVELKAEKQRAKEKMDEANDKLKEKQTLHEKVIREESQVTNKLKEYSSMIVDSPSSVLSEMENLRKKERELAELSEEKRDMVESKMKDHKKLEVSLDKLQHLTQELGDLLKLIDQHKEQTRALSGVEKTTSDLTERLAELKSTLLAIKSKKRNRQEALQALHLKWSALKPQLMESVESAIREFNEKKDVKNKMINSLQEDASIEENINSIKQKMVAHIESFNQTYKLLKQEELKFYDKLEINLLNRQKQLHDAVREKYGTKENKDQKMTRKINRK